MRSVTTGPRPGRDVVDPLLAEHPGVRLIVHGDDADLAAVVLRLLRRSALGTEVAYLPVHRNSAAVRNWGLPSSFADAAGLARTGTARPQPLLRDDNGGVLVGRGEIPDLYGEAYCDAVRVLHGRVPRLVVDAGPDGVRVRSGRGVTAATGRAVQIGTTGATPVRDGEPYPRETKRWAWYRHTEPWNPVLPD
ncbi:hypothetical protein [Pseudonocardia sp. HH130630-07]|uniref:hypothetical protein n=1 Tax=Pseudonocardia sp. HH130630-07 TaxID=1690815 RepID=UPI0008152126|nr:hypothetical protein [Pseudonocardia sp. HH130630-07]ANY09994.1 hypothetical protein AFB00_11955 [Pseudonocardia sp. HH130630-07]